MRTATAPPETWAIRWKRRAATIPIALVLGCTIPAIAIGLLPVWLLADVLVGRRFGITRTAIAFAGYGVIEVLGLVVCVFVWLLTLGQEARALRVAYLVQAYWTYTMYRMALFLFSCRVVIDRPYFGGDPNKIPPTITFIRHVSVFDGMLPSCLIGVPYPVRQRYVAKAELIKDPIFDIIGQRIPSLFVHRGAGIQEELAALRALAAGLSNNDGLVIYPEGTRFTEGRRVRLIERLRAEGDQERLASAMRLTTVMPLKLGGAIAVLEANPKADVVFCSHAGLEKIRSIRQVLLGKLVGVEICVRFDRTSACDIPKEPEARKAWLMKQWEAVDAFVVARNT